MNIRTRLAALAVAGLGILGTAATMAAPAGASTAGCVGGTAFAGYCGAQADTETHSLAFNVYQATGKAGAEIDAWDVGSYAANDFVALAYQGGAYKEFVYAPNGVPAVVNGNNLCITITGYDANGNGKLDLQPCEGWTWSLWQAASVTGGYTWESKANSQVITANGHGVQMTADNPGESATSRQTWNFDTANS